MACSGLRSPQMKEEVSCPLRDPSAGNHSLDWLPSHLEGRQAAPSSARLGKALPGAVSPGLIAELGETDFWRRRGDSSWAACPPRCQIQSASNSPLRDNVSVRCLRTAKQDVLAAQKQSGTKQLVTETLLPRRQTNYLRLWPEPCIIPLTLDRLSGPAGKQPTYIPSLLPAWPQAPTTLGTGTQELIMCPLHGMGGSPWNWGASRGYPK